LAAKSSEGETVMDNNPYMPPQAEDSPPPTPPAPIPFHRAVLDAWGDLFRSREQLLMRHYSRLVSSQEPGAVLPGTIEEARRRIYAAPQFPQTLECSIEIQESKMVLAARIIAAWIVVWSTLFPLAIIGGLCYWQLRRHPGLTFLTSGYIPLAVLVLFPFLSVLGLGVQGLLLRPFSALLNYLVRCTDRSDTQDAS
jgi:hypothetical protein